MVNPMMRVKMTPCFHQGESSAPVSVCSIMPPPVNLQTHSCGSRTCPSAALPCIRSHLKMKGCPAKHNDDLAGGKRYGNPTMMKQKASASRLKRRRRQAQQGTAKKSRKILNTTLGNSIAGNLCHFIKS